MEEIGAMNEATQMQEVGDLVNKITTRLETELEPPLTSKCCIYRIPDKIREQNEVAYSPKVISIGPFHYGKGLKSLRNLKLRYVKSFCERAYDRLLEHYVRTLKEMEDEIRGCYAEKVEVMDSDEFVEMILTDSCFIFEYFLRYHMNTRSEEDEVLLRPWLENCIETDLILLENQIPFFVLKSLYELALESPTFVELTLGFFSWLQVRQIDETIDNIKQVRHFTDLIRVFYLPPADEQLSWSSTGTKLPVHHLPSASELRKTGLEFSAENGKGLVHLRFERNVLEMSCFEVYDDTEIRVRNVMAFEQCHNHGVGYVSQYMLLLDFLINTSEDVDLLVKRGIIVNWLGDSSAVATMVNRLCKHCTIPSYEQSHYSIICEDLNAVHKKHWRKWKAGLIRDYFNSPWKTAASIAAMLILLLTSIQTICSIISLVKQK